MLFEPLWSYIDFHHYGVKSAMVYKGTTRAYKRMENGMLWSEIGSGSKEPGGTPPPRIPRSTPLPRVQSCPF